MPKNIIFVVRKWASAQLSVTIIPRAGHLPTCALHKLSSCVYASRFLLSDLGMISFAFFTKLILLGVGFLNRTGVEIGYRE